MCYAWNVGVLLYNGNRNVFLGHRTYGGFSLPQGNLEEGESFIEAAVRELYEETGLRNVKNLILLDDVVSYAIPSGGGKLQRWVFAEWCGGESVSFDRGPYVEFKAYEWCSLEQAISKCVWFKRDVYKYVAEKFHEIVR